MTSRILVAALGIPAVLAALFWPGGKPFAAVAALIAVVALMELAAAVAAEDGTAPPLLWPLLGIGTLLTTALCPETAVFRMPALTLLFLAAFAAETLSGAPRPFQRLCRSLLLTAYPGLMAVPVALRMRLDVVVLPGLPSLEAGAAWVAVALLLVWATDTGAFFAGRAFGRRKLAPHLSPGKTWAGAAGGWLCAALAGWALGRWGAGVLFTGGASGLLLGMLAGVWAQVGDLAESALKRELGVKDFGGWLPGHGGVLDRFDSFLFVCPLVFLWAAGSFF